MTRKSGKRSTKSKPGKKAPVQAHDPSEPVEAAQASPPAEAGEGTLDDGLEAAPEAALPDDPDPESFARGAISPEPAEAPSREESAESVEEEIDAPVPGEDDAEGPGLENTRPQATGEAHLQSILESLIFVSDAPVSAPQLAKAARASLAQVKRILDDLRTFYATRGIHLIEVSGGYQFRTPAANAPFVRDWVAAKPVRLTRAQLETLAIVAYRQPVTRPEVDEIRGVDSGSALKVLADRGLIKFLGRRDEAGRPLLYGTTPQFLEFFGLGGLKDLPTLREFSELSDESRALFERRMGEPLDLKAVAEESAAQDAERAAHGFEDEEGEAPGEAEAEPSEEAVLNSEDAGERAARVPAREADEESWQ